MNKKELKKEYKSNKFYAKLFYAMFIITLGLSITHLIIGNYGMGTFGLLFALIYECPLIIVLNNAKEVSLLKLKVRK